jgi:hypothetical protein
MIAVMPYAMMLAFVLLLAHLAVGAVTGSSEDAYQWCDACSAYTPAEHQHEH